MTMKMKEGIENETIVKRFPPSKSANQKQTRPDRIIPLVIRHNATVYIPSMDLIMKMILEVSRSLLSKHVCIATVRYE